MQLNGIALVLVIVEGIPLLIRMAGLHLVFSQCKWVLKHYRKNENVEEVCRWRNEFDIQTTNTFNHMRVER
jgi:hypothetical protein